MIGRSKRAFHPSETEVNASLPHWTLFRGSRGHAPKRPDRDSFQEKSQPYACARSHLVLFYSRVRSLCPFLVSSMDPHGM